MHHHGALLRISLASLVVGALPGCLTLATSGALQRKDHLPLEVVAGQREEALEVCADYGNGYRRRWAVRDHHWTEQQDLGVSVDDGERTAVHRAPRVEDGLALDRTGVCTEFVAGEPMSHCDLALRGPGTITRVALAAALPVALAIDLVTFPLQLAIFYGVYDGQLVGPRGLFWP